MVEEARLFSAIERSTWPGLHDSSQTSETEAANLKSFFPASNCAVLALGIPEARGPDYEGARQSLG